MNPNTRTECVEVLFNQAELRGLDAIRGALGRSPFIRSLCHAAGRTHGKPPAPPKESRGCRGVGRAASRHSAGLLVRRQV